MTSTTQLDLTGRGGSTSNQTVSLYNADSAATTVTGTYRELGPESQIGDTVNEQVSAPAGDPTTFPADGAQAAPDVTFTVPAGLDRLDADMIWPDATNGNVLNFVLTDPDGKLRQVSYDYGAAKTGGIGSVPDIQHVEVANPTAGQWTAQIKWGNGRSHLQEAPNVPGTYTGPVSFKVAGQNFVTSPASSPVTIASHASATIPLSVAFPATPGDHPESVQFAGVNAAGTPTVTMSLPIARRTLIPSEGGPFNTVFSSSVGRGLGGIQTYDINVPAGDPDLGVTMETADASADNPYSFYLVNPAGTAVTHTVNGRATSANTFTANAGGQGATAHVANPTAGTWEIDVKLNLTTSGKEFSQTVFGDVLPHAPAITAPASGTTVDTLTPTISGTGTAGDTVSVVDSTGTAICGPVPVLADGTWSCTSVALTNGPETLTATQADSTGDPSSPSAAVTITPPIQTSVALSVAPAAPVVGQKVDLTATTTGVPDGTVLTFSDGTTALGTGTVTGGTATLAIPAGLGEGDHQLTASVPATDTTLAATSPAVDVTVTKSATSISLTMSAATVVYGTTVSGSIAVAGATEGTATLTFGTNTKTVDIGPDGKGTFSVSPNLHVGSYTFSATYNGTATVAASGPVTSAVTVTKEASTLMATPGATSAKRGSTIKVLLTVGGHVGGDFPSGAVSVVATTGSKSTTIKGTLLQRQHGAITLSVTLPNVAGRCSLKAYFAGDENYLKATPATATVNAV